MKERLAYFVAGIIVVFAALFALALHDQRGYRP